MKVKTDKFKDSKELAEFIEDMDIEQKDIISITSTTFWHFIWYKIG